MDITALLPGKLWASIGAVAILSGALFGAYMVIDSRGYARCEGATASANAKVIQEDTVKYLAAIDWGNQISQQLSDTQRKLNATKSEYLKYANSIVGVCDPSFRVFVEYASGAKDGMSETSSTSVDGTITQDPLDTAFEEAMARATATNIAENYSRLDACVSEKLALNRWHRPEGALK